jgi:hypothetical protein
MSKIKPHLPSSEPTHTICISKVAPVSELLARVSEKWGNVTPARFWHAQVNFLEQDPIHGIFYSSSRIENDSTQPFAAAEVDKKKRLDEAGLEDGDAIIMETKHGEEWTIDLETATLGQRINRPKAQEPKVVVFTEEQMAKYRNHRAIRPDVNSSYSLSQPGSGFVSTTYTTLATTPSQPHPSPPVAPTSEMVQGREEEGPPVVDWKDWVRRMDAMEQRQQRIENLLVALAGELRTAGNQPNLGRSG